MSDFADDILSGGQSKPSKDFAEDILLGPRLTTPIEEVTKSNQGSALQQGIAEQQAAAQEMGAEFSPGTKEAKFATMVKAAMVDDPETQLRIYAKDLFPNLSPDEARGRIGKMGDDIVYLGDDGNVYRANPEGGLGWAKENIAAGTLGKTLPIAGGAIGGMVAGGPAASAFGIGLGTAGGEGVRKIVGAMVFDEPIDWQTVAKSMATEGLWSLAGAGLSYGLAKGIEKGRVARDINRFDPAQAGALEAKAKQQGIQLTPAEISNLPSLKQQQKTLSNLPQTSDRLGEFADMRGKQIDEAVRRYLDSVSIEDTPELAGRRGKEAAASAIEKAIKDRSDAARPYYEQAFKKFKGLPQGMVRRAEALMQRPAMVTAAKQAQELAANEGIDLGDPRQSLLGMHYMKLALDRQIKQGKLEGMTATENRAMVGLKNELTDMIVKASPKDKQGRSYYGLAKDIFEHNSPAVSGVTDGIVGSMADVSDTKLTEVPKVLFSAGANEISKAKRSIKAVDPEGWQQVKRAALQQLFEGFDDSPTQGARWAGKLGKSEMMRKLEAALEPNELRALNDLLEVLKATNRAPLKGSDTAWNLASQSEFKTEAKGVIGRLLTNLRDIATGKWGDMYGEFRYGRYADKLAQIITSPDGMRQLRQLRLMNPRSIKFANGVAGLLGAAAAPTQAEETDQLLVAP